MYSVTFQVLKVLYEERTETEVLEQLHASSAAYYTMAISTDIKLDHEPTWAR